jgi:MFS family permease
VNAFAPVSLLRRRDVRLLSLGSLFESVGMAGEQVVLGWLTLELTNSPLAVGLALGLRMAPMLVAGLPAGVVADRSDRVRLLRLSGYGMGAASAALGVLSLAGVVALWHVLVVTVLSGCVRTLFQTARQTYTHDLVGPGELVHAVALLGVAMRVGGLAGALLTGALVARLGPGAGYLGVAAGFLTGSLVFAWTPAAGGPVATARESVWAGFVDFVRVLRRDRVLPGLIALTAAVEVLGFSHQALLPSLARDVLHVGAGGLGVMTGARSVGGILGITAIAALSQAGRTGSLFLGVLVVFGVSLVVLGFASGFLWVVLLLVLVNAVGSVSDVLSQSLVQLSAPRALRGRAGGAWVVAIGTAPLGQLQIGALASLLGVSTALGLHGLALVALAVAATVWFPRLRRL